MLVFFAQISTVKLHFWSERSSLWKRRVFFV